MRTVPQTRDAPAKKKEAGNGRRTRRRRRRGRSRGKGSSKNRAAAAGDIRRDAARTDETAVERLPGGEGLVVHRRRARRRSRRYRLVELFD